MASEFPLIMSSARQKSAAVALKTLRVAASASLPGYRVRSGIFTAGRAPAQLLRSIWRPQSARYLATPGSENSLKSSTGGQQQPLSLSVYNPFLNGTPKVGGMVGWFKIVLGLPIAVVRVALMVPLAAVCAPWGYLSLVGYKPGNNPSLPAPLRGWRAVLFFPCRLFARGVLFLLGFHWVKIKGQIAPAIQAPLLLPNHLGFVVAKAEIERQPIIGPLSAGALNVFVLRRPGDKGGPTAQTIAQVKTTIDARAKNMGAGGYPHLCLYPEGTTTNGTAIISFKLGAFLPGMPVQPVVISHAYRDLDPSLTQQCAYYPLRLLTQFHQRLTVEFLPVYTPSEAEKKDPALFAEGVRKKMSAALGVKTTEHSLGDFFLLKAAMSAGLDAGALKSIASSNLKTDKLEQLTRLKAADLRFYMNRFASFDKDKSGSLSLYEFLEAMELPLDDEWGLQLFETFDHSQDGTLDYKEFVAGLMYINANVDSETTARMAFELFDLQHDGRVTFEELGMAFKQLNISTYKGKEGQVKLKTLFDAMDKSGEGFVTKEEAVAYLKANPQVLSCSTKTALLERFKNALVVDMTGKTDSAALY